MLGDATARSQKEVLVSRSAPKKKAAPACSSRTNLNYPFASERMDFGIYSRFPERSPIFVPSVAVMRRSSSDWQVNLDANVDWHWPYKSRAQYHKCGRWLGQAVDHVSALFIQGLALFPPHQIRLYHHPLVFLYHLTIELAYLACSSASENTKKPSRSVPASSLTVKKVYRQST